MTEAPTQTPESVTHEARYRQIGQDILQFAKTHGLYRFWGNNSGRFRAKDGSDIRLVYQRRPAGSFGGDTFLLNVTSSDGARIKNWLYEYDDGARPPRLAEVTLRRKRRENTRLVDKEISGYSGGRLVVGWVAEGEEPTDIFGTLEQDIKDLQSAQRI